MTGKAIVFTVLAAAVAALAARAGAAEDEIAALGRAVADIAIEPETVARWPIHGLLGAQRVDLVSVRACEGDR